MDRLTYRMGDNSYLKGGLDGKWSQMERYHLIEAAVAKLAEYEDKEEMFGPTSEQVKAIIAERDSYKIDILELKRLIKQMADELLDEDYYSDAPCDFIVHKIIEKYSRKKRGLLGRFFVYKED